MKRRRCAVSWLLEKAIVEEGLVEEGLVEEGLVEEGLVAKTQEGQTCWWATSGKSVAGKK